MQDTYSQSGMPTIVANIPSKAKTFAQAARHGKMPNTTTTTPRATTTTATVYNFRDLKAAADD